MTGKKWFLFNPIDLLAGILLVISGILVISGNVNLGTVLAGLGLLIEAIKIMVQKGI